MSSVLAGMGTTTVLLGLAWAIIHIPTSIALARVLGCSRRRLIVAAVIPIPIIPWLYLWFSEWGVRPFPYVPRSAMIEHPDWDDDDDDW